MPIYEYRCTDCGHQFEVTHGVGETVERCEKCGGPVRKVFSSVGIIFKGSGFHVTDYRKTPAPVDGQGKAASEKAKAGDASKPGETSKAGDKSATSDGSSETSGSAAASSPKSS